MNEKKNVELVIRWVAVSERLPEMEVDVLLFDDWKTTAGGRRQDMKVGYLSEFTTRKTADGIAYSCEWRGHEFLFNITHWMPLPEPPSPNISLCAIEVKQTIEVL